MQENLPHTEVILAGHRPSWSNQKAVKMEMETKGEPSEGLHGATSGNTPGPGLQSGASDPPAVTAAGQELQRLVLGTGGDTTVPVKENPVNRAQQSYVRPVWQPASFIFEEGNLDKKDTTHEQQRPAVVSGEAPQVPAVSIPEQNSRLLPNDTTAHHGPRVITVQDSVAYAGQEYPTNDCTDISIEVDVEQGPVPSNMQDFSPLVTEEVVDPHSASGQQPQQESGDCGSTFTSDTSYVHQEFKKTDTVLFQHQGAKEELPSRKFLIKELLCKQMGFRHTIFLFVIQLPDRQGYYVRFRGISYLRYFWANISKFQDMDSWNKFTFSLVSKQDLVDVTITFSKETVLPQDIVIWLQRHCDLLSDLTKKTDRFRIWTGEWRILVKLRQSQNVTHHLPYSFFIGRVRGICRYEGQPKECYTCGEAGHLASACSMQKCSMCGEVGHEVDTCPNIRCDLCDQIGHFDWDCSGTRHDEELQVENLKKEAPLSRLALGSLEASSDIRDTVQVGITEGNMEAVEVAGQGSQRTSSDPVSTSDHNKSTQKKHKSRLKSGGEKDMYQKPDEKEDP
ncbi:uncharacterized protein LOC142301207 [Anomaloglossus baeobatrachus]|uniref:uncharacterized protein LOC142301207 n=1 Tax=Anomaloglossus baeobatrachus TaxID=238106 RepID=UPI003F4FE03A